MRRFYVPEIGDAAAAGKSEAEHITRVLRMGPGDAVVLFDGSGWDYPARIAEVSARGVLFTVSGKHRNINEPRIRLTVYQAVIKHDHFEYAVQKCTELGAHAIVPFVSERCVRRPSAPDRFTERARRVALEAAKQCGRSFVPRVGDILEWSDVVTRAAQAPTLLAYESERKRTLKQALPGDPPEIMQAVIGPEGGFTPAEADALTAAGAVPVSLGKLILRAETASAAATAMILYEYEQ